MPVYKRNRVWYYEFKLNKIRYKKSVPAAQSKRDAEQAEAEAKRQVFQGTYGKPTGDTHFIKFAETAWLDWVTHNKRGSHDRYYLPAFRNFFGQKTFREITPLLLEKYKRERRATPTRAHNERSAATVNRELAALSRIFELAIQARLTDTNPVRQVKFYREDNARTRYLTSDEETRLWQVLDGWEPLRLIVLIAMRTGMRRGEILKLEWEQIDFSRDLIHVRDTKSGRDRFLPMSPDLRADLEAIAQPTGFVFPSPRQSQTGHLQEIKKAWHSALKQAGITGFRFHDLRHTAATRLADIGADPFTIASLLGHADLRMTQRYTHATDENRRAAITQLSRFQPKVPNEYPSENVRQFKKVLNY